MTRKVLFLDFVTELGGVSSVMLNLLPRLRKNIDIYFLDPYGSELVEMMKQNGVPVIDMPMKTKKTALGWGTHYRRPFILLKYSWIYLIYIMKLSSYMKGNSFSLIHVNSKKSLIIANIVNLITGIPIVYHSHGFNRSKDIGVIYRWAISRAALVIAVSEDVLRKLVEANIERRKITLIYNGVDIQLIRRRLLENDTTNIHMETGTYKILLAANFHAGKGIHIALDAACELKNRGVDYLLLIAGDTPVGGDESYKRLLEKKVEDEGLSNHVLFIGKQKNIFKILNIADVVILPSLDTESFGMIIAEAMALGKPVVGTNVGGIPEVIEDEVTGFIVDPGDPFGMAKKLEILYRDFGLREVMGAEGHKRAEKYFTVERQAQEVERAFLRALNIAEEILVEK